MYINSDWRILTIGDGDLSFSMALFNRFKLAQLTATVYDSEAELSAKYGSQHIEKLRQVGIEPCFKVDVFSQNSWQGVGQHEYDAVIFQFPLIPNAASNNHFLQQQKMGDSNLLHRRLIHRFLLNACQHWLAPHGAGYAIVSNKVVKPYSHWNLEGSVAQDTGMNFAGTLPFNIRDFPGYAMRNVDRALTEKTTRGMSYYWRMQGHDASEFKLQLPETLQPDFCPLCGKGPFTVADTYNQHIASTMHQRLARYEANWQQYLQQQ